jgi:hypothetical protein
VSRVGLGNCCFRCDGGEAAGIIRLLVLTRPDRQLLQDVLNSSCSHSIGSVIRELQKVMEECYGPGTFKILCREATTLEGFDGKIYTPLMCAAENRIGGLEIIPILLECGLEVDGQVFECACRKGNGEIVQFILQLRPEVVRSFTFEWVLENDADPCGIISSVGRSGCAWYPTREDVLRLVHELKTRRYLSMSVNQSREVLWLVLHVGLHHSCPELLDLALTCNKSADMWQILTSELNTFRESESRNTLLHRVAQTGNVDALRRVIKQRINPLLLNGSGQRAIDLVPYDAAHDLFMKEFAEYTKWKPDQVDILVQWYGPFFRKRAKALCLVLKRHKVISRDVKLWLLSFLAATEVVECERIFQK